MKLLFKILSGMLAVCLLFGTAACTPAADPGNGDDTGNEPGPGEIETPLTTEYVAKVESPDYPEISDEIEYTVYYFDSENGSDSNSGLSESAPKKTLSEAERLISAVEEEMPTKILFKAGSEYENDTFTMTGFNAAEESPLIVSVYGQTEENRYVRIVGPELGNCAEIKSGNIRVSYLECTSPLGYRGIHVTTNKGGAMKNVVVSDCYVHDINYDLEGITLPEGDEMPDSATVQEICPNGRFSYNCGGIIFEADTPKAKGASWYENVWIDNNRIERVARTGIWVFSNWAQRPGVDWGRNPYYDDETNWFHHSNVNIRGNYLSHTGGDGIILGVTVGGFIEYNTCYHAQYLGRANYYCAAIWSHSCKNLVFQYNEAAYTHTGYDGQGFDIDIGNSNILFQYNYSHHNDGGGLLCCHTSTNIAQYDKDGNLVLDEDGLPIIEKKFSDWSNVIVRNNVFADNDVADLILSGPVRDIWFENNTVIKSGIIENEKIVDSKDFGGTRMPGENFNFSNNIFFSRQENSARFAMEFTASYYIDNNVYYGFGDEFETYMRDEIGEKNYVSADPGFASDLAAQTGYENAKVFVPTNMALFSNAKTLETMLKYDFANADVEGQHYYGAFGKAA